MKGQWEQWGKKTRVYYECFSKIEKVLDQREQKCRKTTTGLISTAE